MDAYDRAEEYDLERHLRDMSIPPIVGGSSNRQKNNIANRLGPSLKFGRHGIIRARTVGRRGLAAPARDDDAA